MFEEIEKRASLNAIIIVLVGLIICSLLAGREILYQTTGVKTQGRITQKSHFTEKQTYRLYYEFKTIKKTFNEEQMFSVNEYESLFKPGEDTTGKEIMVLYSSWFPDINKIVDY